MYSLGIDIGYASVKVVLVDGEGEVRYQRYQLHKGNAKGLVRRFMADLSKDGLMSEIAYGAATGSGAALFGKDRYVSSVNEVTALVEGAAAAGSPARSIVEIGGQGAKYITGLGAGNLSGIKIAMNSSCSAGTGSFLEEQVSRLNLELEDYSVLAARAETIPMDCRALQRICKNGYHSPSAGRSAGGGHSHGAGLTRSCGTTGWRSCESSPGSSRFCSTGALPVTRPCGPP